MQKGYAMKDQINTIRLTDELERQLMMQAIEDQFRFKPSVALKGLLHKVSGLFHASRTVAHS
jgi:hypothetical protein